MRGNLGIALAVVGLIFQSACARPIGTSSSAVAFATFGSPREVVEANLKLAHGTIAQSSEGVLVARLDTKQLLRPMNVNLTFSEGKLSAVNWWPIPLARGWSYDSPLGRFGYGRFIDNADTKPLQHQFLYFGPLGFLYIGSDGLAMHPTGATLSLGILSLVGLVGMSFWTRRKLVS
jgi:hypothetical protein